MLWIKRAAALLFSLALIVSSGAPAMAVTPQEGWFIQDRITWSGEDYYVIDNKMSDSDWWINFTSQRVVYDFDGSSYVDGRYNEIASFGTLYRGFSETNWRIDQDWVMRLTVSQVLRNGSATSLSVKPILYDCTQTPSYTLTYPRGDGASYDFPETLVNLTEDSITAIPYNNSTFISPTIASGDWNADLYIPVSDCSIPTLLSGYNTSLNGSDINNVCLGFVYSGDSDSYKTSVFTVRAAVQWMIPVDKSPSGMAVGDYWPKVRPIEVELEEAMNAYEEAMLQNGQINDPSDIHTMFGQLGGMQEDGLGALDFGEDEATVLPGVISIIQPVITFLFPFFGLVLILLIFANKGIHG